MKKELLFAATLFATACGIAQAQLAPFLVTTVDDSGPGTLRQAIVDANGTVGQNTIAFDIPGSGPHVIQPITPLPDITDAVFIDGYSQPGSAPNSATVGDNADIRILLDGSALVNSIGDNETGLVFRTVGGLVTGLSIVNFADAGIRIEKPNPLDPPLVTDCNVFGNYIGVLPDGSTAGGNGDGIVITFGARGNIIGGPAPLQQNLISGNAVRAMIMDSRGNRIQGNLVGLNAAGDAAVGGGAGIFMLLSGNADGDDTLIGGDTPEAGNVLSGIGTAILVSGNPADPAAGIRIGHNRIGVSDDGSASVPNPLGSGIVLSDTLGAEIHDNTIAASLNGISLAQGVTNTSVADNLIGPFIDGGNDIGLQITNGARNNRIGTAGEGNTIRFSRFAGVSIQGADTVGNRLQGNRIHDNGLLGVDLGNADSGPTPNDPDDADAGGNGLINYPLITDAQVGNGQWTATLEYRGAPGIDLTFELFAGTECDASGFGEGERPIGRVAATTDGSGSAVVSASFPEPPPGFAVLTANASDSAGNTSEFGPCGFPVGQPPLDAVAVSVDSPGTLAALGLLLCLVGLIRLRAAA